jgi:protein-tyrosine phosphatase
MIDVHSHILPDIDDGAVDLNESLRMCRIACDDGIRIMVATPHAFNGEFLTSPEAVRESVASLTRAIAAEKLGLKILPGMELRVAPDLPDKIAGNKLLTLNSGRYILLELPPAHIPAGFESLVRKISSMNYGIVLAHPEKNLLFQDNPKILLDLKRSLNFWDLVGQVSADSVLGDAGRIPLKTAKWLLKHNAAHIIASDCHSDKERPPRLAKAVGVAAKWIGKDKAWLLVEDIPRAVLTGLGFPRMEDEAPRKWWRFF